MLLPFTTMRGEKRMLFHKRKVPTLPKELRHAIKKFRRAVRVRIWKIRATQLAHHIIKYFKF